MRNGTQEVTFQVAVMGRCDLTYRSWNSNPSIPQTEIPTLLEGWVKYTPSVKILYPQKTAFRYIFVRHIMRTCGSLSHFSVPYKFTYQ